MKFTFSKQSMYSIALLAVSLLFYIFFAIYDGAVICVDSPSYINMHISREPLYPIFLFILRHIFSDGTDFYLTVAAALQSILAAVAAFVLTDYLRKQLKLSLVASYIVLAFPLATSLLCRFAAKRSSMYSNSILTEGIACSLFLIFFRYLFEYCLHRTKRGLVMSCILSFIMIATRKQMYLTLFLLILCIIFVSIKSRCLKKGIITLILCCFSILACNLALENAYVYAVHGSVGTHSSDNRFLATMVFYTAEKQDFQHIEDENLRNLAEEIYDICDVSGYVKHSAGKGWFRRVTHFGDYYDCIQIDTMWPAIEKYVNSHYSGDSITLEKKVDAITDEIIASVLPHVYPKVLATFADNFLSGLITTVAQRKPILILYTVFIYFIYIAALLLQIAKKRFSPILLFSVLTLFSIVINVSIVSAVIFCQTRYTIYNMPLFYISLFLLIWQTIRFVPKS